MKIHALVKPGRKRESLGWDGERLIVVVQAPPVEGAANERLVEMLADWLGLSKSRVAVVKGWTSPHKTLEIGAQEMVVRRAAELLPRLPRQEQLF